MTSFSAAAKGPIAIVMGSTSDWPTLQRASEVLNELDVPHECHIVSAHRTPDRLWEFAESAEDRGLEAIIAGAGGAAHLPGMIASKTVVPVLGVPVRSETLRGVDSLLSIVQMPAGIGVATFSIGEPGAANAALTAAAIVSNRDSALRERLRERRRAQTQRVLEAPVPWD